MKSYASPLILSHSHLVRAGSWDLDKNSFESKEQLSPLFERFCILGGPRGFRCKKLQNLDSMQLEGGFSGIRFPHVGLTTSRSFNS
jgi:hypothetical protein